MGAELFHADGRTDGPTEMTKIIVALRDYANAPVNKPLKCVRFKVDSAVTEYFFFWNVTLCHVTSSQACQ